MQYGYKNAQFDAAFESVEKVKKTHTKKVYQRKSDRNLGFDFYYCVQKFSAYNF